MDLPSAVDAVMFLLSLLLLFFMPFSSVPSLGNDSSVNFGMPRNEHFLPRNNGSHSESIPRNFFGTKFRCQWRKGGGGPGICD
jgi:hypothetical protein